MNKRFIAAIAFAAGTVLSAGAVQAQDAAAGEKVFKKCAACHSLEAGKRKVGPSLHGVFEGNAGTSEGYKYSAMLAAAGEAGLVWNEETMSAYLADTNAFLKAYLDEKGVKARGRSKMSFKLPKEQDQKDVIAYLQSATK